LKLWTVIDRRCNIATTADLETQVYRRPQPVPLCRLAAHNLQPSHGGTDLIEIFEIAVFHGTVFAFMFRRIGVSEGEH